MYSGKKCFQRFKALGCPQMQPNRKALDGKLRQLTMRMAEEAPRRRCRKNSWAEKFGFPANDQKIESVTLKPGSSNNGYQLVTQTAGVESRIDCGYHEWRRGRAPFGTYVNEPVAATGAWTANDTYVVRLCATETPYVVTIKLRSMAIACSMTRNRTWHSVRTSELS